MAEDEDTGADGRGKARTFSAEDLTALRGTLPAWSGALSVWCFGEVLRVWLLRHPDPYSAQEHATAEWKKSRKQNRDDFKKISDGIDQIISILARIEDNHSLPHIMHELEPPHNPGLSLLAGDPEREKIMHAKMRAILANLEALREAAIGARSAHKLESGRPHERRIEAALDDLCRIYRSATGRMPTESNSDAGHGGPWLAFGREATSRGWGRRRSLTGHLRAAALRLKEEPQRLIEQQKRQQFYAFARWCKISAYHARLPPSHSEGA